MTQADRVLSTPPTNTPIDRNRRRFLAVAASASAASAGALAVAAMPAAAGIPIAADPAFALIAAKRAADLAHDRFCDALNEAEVRSGVGSDEADEVFTLGGPACHTAYEAGWPLATIPPTTLAGVVAVLRFANEIEDGGMEWPNTDTIGREGWHYQLRATMAQAIETIIRKGAA